MYNVNPQKFSFQFSKAPTFEYNVYEKKKLTIFYSYMQMCAFRP